MFDLARVLSDWLWSLYAVRMLRRAVGDTWDFAHRVVFPDYQRGTFVLVVFLIALVILLWQGQGQTVGEEVSILLATLLVLVVVCLGVFLFNVVMTPSRMQRDAVSSIRQEMEMSMKALEVDLQASEKREAELADRVANLEEARKPKLAIECQVEKGHPLGQRLSLAYLVVSNLGEEGIQNAYDPAPVFRTVYFLDDHAASAAAVNRRS